MTLKLDLRIKAVAEAAAVREHRSMTSVIEVLILNRCEAVELTPARNAKEKH
ncbi:hypothetical protein [Delftia lacustris]|uniref:hypothetical protein n=1 Tax=Delftia lacustris TaxID=558537 RepID=UPI0012E21757|nr:hypothetical protein [Delftia lacustris]